MIEYMILGIRMYEVSSYPCRAWRSEPMIEGYYLPDSAHNRQVQMGDMSQVFRPFISTEVRKERMY